MSEPSENPSPSRLILFQSEDEHARIEVRLDGGTVWLTQAQMAELYQRSVPNINLHLRAIYDERELSEQATIKRYLIVREAYLEFAELQARNRKPMHMADWIAKPDDFLRLSEREILN